MTIVVVELNVKMVNKVASVLQTLNIIAFMMVTSNKGRLANYDEKSNHERNLISVLNEPWLQHETQSVFLLIQKDTTII